MGVTGASGASDFFSLDSDFGFFDGDIVSSKDNLRLAESLE
jgi:hypothetical protein